MPKRLSILIPMHFWVCLTLMMFSLFLSFPAFAQSLNTHELSLFNRINRYRLEHQLPFLKVDKLSSTVARKHSFSMKSENFFSLNHPKKGSLLHQLAYRQLTGRVTNSVIASDKTSGLLFEQLKSKKALLDPDTSHLGVGIVQEGVSPFHTERMWLTLVFTHYMAEILPPKKSVALGDTIEIKGKLLSGFSDPRLPVTFPNGKVAVYRNKSVGNSFLFEVPTFKKGKYTLELLVTSPNKGTKVASIMPVYAGEKFPEIEPLLLTKNQNFKTSDAAALHMVELINESRKHYKINTLKSDPMLKYVAYLHSEDMAKRAFFAHLNPEGEDPNHRFRKNGGFGWVGENIVVDTQVESAFSDLMNSPGHRSNILGDDFTHVGVGVYFHQSKYYITQLFQKKHNKIDLKSTRRKIYKWASHHRKMNQVPMFITDPILSLTAYQHSKSMAKNQKLSYLNQGVPFTQHYVKNKGRLSELKTIILFAESVDKIEAELKKHKAIFTQNSWRYWGLGVYQGNHKKYGENILWVTIGLGK